MVGVNYDDDDDDNDGNYDDDDVTDLSMNPCRLLSLLGKMRLMRDM